MCFLKILTNHEVFHESIILKQCASCSVFMENPYTQNFPNSISVLVLNYNIKLSQSVLLRYFLPR